MLRPVPVRFSPADKRRLENVARRFRLNSSEIIRRAVEKALPEWESRGVFIIESSK